MVDDDSRRDGLYARIEPHLTLDAHYTPNVNETGDGYAVWDVGTAEQIQETESLEAAIELARQMNNDGGAREAN